jgi:hypothetical protein
VLQYRWDMWTAVWLTCPADGCQRGSRSVTTNLHFTKLIYFVIRNSVNGRRGNKCWGSWESWYNLLELSCWRLKQNCRVSLRKPLVTCTAHWQSHGHAVCMWNCHARSSRVLLRLSFTVRQPEIEFREV